MLEKSQLSEPFFARFLALMAIADEKVMDIETANAEALLELFELNENNSMLAEYQSAIKNMSTDLNSFSSLHKMTSIEQLGLIRSCWLIATCDGELHPNEEHLFYKLIDECNLPRRKAMESLMSGISNAC